MVHREPRRSLLWTRKRASLSSLVVADGAGLASGLECFRRGLLTLARWVRVPDQQFGNTWYVDRR